MRGPLVRSALWPGLSRCPRLCVTSLILRVISSPGVPSTWGSASRWCLPSVLLANMAWRIVRRKPSCPEWGLASSQCCQTSMQMQSEGMRRCLNRLYIPKLADRFHTMSVRLGQIAGSRTSEYWNPLENFGFLIKSSQTPNASQDADGNTYRTTINDRAGAFSDLILSNRSPRLIYHIENLVG